MQFPEDSVVGETLIVLSLDSENNLFLFNLNRWAPLFLSVLELIPCITGNPEVSWNRVVISVLPTIGKFRSQLATGQRPAGRVLRGAAPHRSDYEN
jgi:hypothetical protein